MARCFQGYTVEIVGQRLSQIGQSSPQPREIAAGGSNPYDRVVIGPEQRLWLHSGWRGVLIREFSRWILDDPDIAVAIEPLASSSDRDDGHRPPAHTHNLADVRISHTGRAYSQPYESGDPRALFRPWDILERSPAVALGGQARLRPQRSRYVSPSRAGERRVKGLADEPDGSLQRRGRC